MNSALDLEKLSGHESVILLKTAAVWFVAGLGILTVVTHVSQLLSISFAAYAYLVLGVSFILAIGLSVNSLRWLKQKKSSDKLSLVLVLAAAGLAAWFVLLSQPTSPFGDRRLDDYYYLANPVFYVQHPQQALTFKMQDYYSGQAPFTSAAFLVAGAYQYIQAAFAFLLKADYIKLAYFFVSPIAGAMFPIALYLVLTKLCEDTVSAAIGALVALLLILIMGETSISPGLWVFSRVFDGKSILVSTGVCLLLFFSLDYFAQSSFWRWLLLLFTCAALAGLSTTAVMLVPALSAVVFADYYFVLPMKLSNLLETVLAAAKYFASLSYLVASGIYLAVVDTIQLAAHANQAFPDTFMGTAGQFIDNAPFPTTVVVLVVFSILAVVFMKGGGRRFVLGLILLPFLILNPVVSDFLARIFRGIYFRMFYILPLFTVLGLATAGFIQVTRRLARPIRAGLWLVAGALVILLSMTFPTSVVGTWHGIASRWSTPESRAAHEVIAHTPQGLMFAPFPLSSIIFTFDSNRPQMYIRHINADLFLWKQGRTGEAALRDAAATFLSQGATRPNDPKYRAFMALIEKYPEIHVVVIKKAALASSPEAELFLQQQGFVHRFTAQNLVAYWR